MLTYLHQSGFQAAANLEYTNLTRQGTFETVSEDSAKGFVIPTKWVFTYKFDKEGYLVKYKAWLVVRGDLQPKTDEETYVATLAARILRLLIALTAYFDLDAY
jgi:hypothetical protein